MRRCCCLRTPLLVELMLHATCITSTYTCGCWGRFPRTLKSMIAAH